jgi:hypothetical protein
VALFFEMRTLASSFDGRVAARPREARHTDRRTAKYHLTRCTAKSASTADSIAYHMGWQKDGETIAVGRRDDKPRLDVQRARTVLERLVRASRLVNLGKQQSPGSKRSVCVYCTPEFVLQCKAVLPDVSFGKAAALMSEADAN